MVPRHRLHLGFAVQLDLEGKDVFAGLLGELFAVDKQGNRFLVGVDLDLDLAAGALGKALGADMHKRVLAPPRLVQVEAVLLGFAVKGDKPLVVHTRLAALVAGIGGKVEHIPDVGTPQPRVALKAAQHIFVVEGLVFLGVVAAAGMLAVQVGHTLGTVLAEAQRAVRVAQVEEIHPQVVQEQPRHIPAQIQVPADEVGNVRHRVKGTAHRIARQRGQAGVVHLVAEVVQHAVVVQHIALVLGRDGDLVGHAPADDAGVVVVLLDQLLHLADGVGAPARHMLADIGDLRPDDHTRLVAQVVEVLVMLVVGKAHGVGAQLLDELHILVVHFPGDGVAQTLAVLMAGNAVQRVGATVQEKALLGVHREAAHAEALGDLVLHRAAAHQTHGAGVEIRVAHAVPQVGVLHRQGGVGAGAGQHGAAGGIGDGDLHLALALDAGLHADVGAAALDGGGDAHAAAAEVIQRDVIFADDQQADIAVDAAVEGEVRLLGVDAVVFAVVRNDSQGVLLCQQGGDVGAEGRVAAVVADDLGAVQGNGGAGVDTLKLQPDLLGVGVKGGLGEGGLVGAAAALIVVAAVLPVDMVPCMGQFHRRSLAVRTGKLPVFHQLGNSAHRCSPHRLVGAVGLFIFL